MCLWPVYFPSRKATRVITVSWLAYFATVPNKTTSRQVKPTHCPNLYKVYGIRFGAKLPHIPIVWVALSGIDLMGLLILVSHLLSVPRVLDLQPVARGQDLHVVCVRRNTEGTVQLRSFRAGPTAAAAVTVRAAAAATLAVAVR